MATHDRIKYLAQGMRWIVFRFNGGPYWHYTPASGRMVPVSPTSISGYWEQTTTTDLVPTLSLMVYLVDCEREFPL